jgi:hypothetical protein
MRARSCREDRPSRCPVIAAIAAATALSLAGIPAFPRGDTGASPRSSSLDLAISIPRTAQLRITCMPHAIDITTADVERGSVSVPLAWCIEIRANVPYEMSFTAGASWFSSALLSGLPVAVEVRDGSGRYEESRPAGASTQRRLGVTFYLKAGTVAGRYAWPLSIALAGR